MYNNFRKYRENKDITSFGQKFDRLCECIAQSEISFDEYWENYALPALLEGSYADEEELLEGFFDRLGDMGRKVGNFFGGSKEVAQQPQFGADTQSKIDSTRQEIKLAFQKAMHNVINRYRQDRNPIGFQLAQAFMDKVSNYMDRIKINRGEGKFDKQAAFGPSKYGKDNTNTGERWKEMFNSPSRDRAINHYAKKFQVPPETIQKLIDNGYTNPNIWGGMIAQYRKNKQNTTPGVQKMPQPNPKPEDSYYAP